MYDEKIVTKVCDTLVKAGSTFLGDKKEAYKKAKAKETNEQAKWTMEKILENAYVAEIKVRYVMIQVFPIWF